MVYNAATPVVDGNTVIYSGAGRGRGTKAFTFEKSAGGVTAKEVWGTTEHAVRFNTPVLKDGFVYGISDRSQLFCLDAKIGKTAWATGLRAGYRGYGSVVDAGAVL